MTRAELGYAAGIIDGEGCISYERPPGVRVRVFNNNQAIITWLYVRFGGRVYSRNNGHRSNNLGWVWELGREESLKFLGQIEPYLVAKQVKAKTILSEQRPRARTRA